ncbi:MAG TPA: hypothetical protein DIT95_21360 [Arenibacter sp.]|nr:hypothetical protein [Arenibacter sp.]|tara:strand:+ start:28842 stop:30086 length:1245 start_codon:yes stop_codon:yes gene_type:complete
MRDNPFLSDTFTQIWSKHFNKDKPKYSFNFVPNLSFIKPTWLPIYFNVGKNNTKGISYSLPSGNAQDYKKKVFLIYDVPTFLDLDINLGSKDLKLTKIRQYPGFLVDLNNYSDFEQYFCATFSKSSRYKLNKYKRRLESCFEISYKMYHGYMKKELYDSLFGQFKKLLEKRFNDKGITNNNLDPKEWAFYHEVTFPLILEKKASLFVIYNGDIPIGITLNYLSDSIVFDAITVFDIDYEKFHLGSVTIMKLIEWSLQNGYGIFDFSKGYYDYKKRWACKEYDFEYHLFWDNRSFIANLISFMIIGYFKSKNYFRERNLNEIFHKITYRLKRDSKVSINCSQKFEFQPILETIDFSNAKKLDYHCENYSHLKNMVFEFLYLNSKNEKDISLFQVLDMDNCYIIVSNNDKHRVTYI